MKLKKTVLVIDDVDEMREMLQALIAGMQDYKVSTTCANCAEARVELSRRKPSLVLLDEILPGESSVDLLQEITSQGIPVILMTGIEHPTHHIPNGAAVRISKPDWDSLEQEASRVELVFNSVVK
jgi:DNA-binding NtrC family response regulator